jgi:hypothetical protein
MTLTALLQRGRQAEVSPVGARSDAGPRRSPPFPHAGMGLAHLVHADRELLTPRLVANSGGRRLQLANLSVEQVLEEAFQVIAGPCPVPPEDAATATDRSSCENVALQ